VWHLFQWQLSISKKESSDSLYGTLEFCLVRLGDIWPKAPVSVSGAMQSQVLLQILFIFLCHGIVYSGPCVCVIILSFYVKLFPLFWCCDGYTTYPDYLRTYFKFLDLTMSIIHSRSLQIHIMFFIQLYLKVICGPFCSFFFWKTKGRLFGCNKESIK
jgi:hypothetical protein